MKSNFLYSGLLEHVHILENKFTWNKNQSVLYITAECCVWKHEQKKKVVFCSGFYLGIAPNTMLAKMCSDQNKPNGQYRIPSEREAVMNFIRDLAIRKVRNADSFFVHCCLITSGICINSLLLFLKVISLSFSLTCIP